MTGPDDYLCLTFERRDRKAEEPLVAFSGFSELEQQRWTPLVQKAKELGPKLFRFQAFFEPGVIRLTGLATEDVRAALVRLFREFSGSEVIDEIIGAGVFIPAETKKDLSQAASDNAVPTRPEVVTVERFPVVTSLVPPVVALAQRPDLQPCLYGLADGVASWVDRSAAAGNGVVSLAAAYAWRTLKARF